MSKTLLGRNNGIHVINAQIVHDTSLSNVGGISVSHF